MAATFILATVLAAGAPAAADSVDVAYDAMMQGKHEVAIEKLEGTDDAARLINLGAAYAAEGRVLDARAAYEKAAFAERYELETADGQWVDSRVLARQALASLDRPYLDTRMAKAD
ncbi:hypothetical protein [Croceicoccus pelagius]|uniref:Tetratricopeptide repeat-containing protein n=1 Tax=Croceicoccus pelagius TaxID=1703341 RepID=A0A916YLP4_9SPHN|nr:hypothetical protein [Croceicoccus pelagius]GGD51939.1 hypothetical protein GCM10010989_27580 [Croceicoccus pelagius]